jgi:hypothetical protein
VPSRVSQRTVASGPTYSTKCQPYIANLSDTL